MVASIPNEIFQFSTHAALHAGFNTGQPRTADLTSHGTHGIGIYEDGSLMLLKDKQAHAIQRNGRATLALANSRLPFAMVTVYEPSFRVKISDASMDALEALVSSNEFGPAKSVNTLTPFKIAGRFEYVELAESPTQTHVDGTMFGFIIPEWMKAISGPRIHAHFLDANEESGGKVVGFGMAEDAVLSFAKCGRFHLGFPQGKEWEDVKL